METIAISALNQYAFCPRRCALMHVEGIWSDNEHTAQGTILHTHTDERGYETVGKAKLLRALPLFSQKYGLSGKADIVELHQKEIIPVEYKKGKIISQSREIGIETNKKRGNDANWKNDAIQLAAQALCLEEMFKTPIKRGFIYHASSKKRREVAIDENLRNLTIETIEKVRGLLADEIVPSAEYKPRCEGCSLYNICLPKLSDANYRKNLEYEL